MTVCNQRRYLELPRDRSRISQSDDFSYDQQSRGRKMRGTSEFRDRCDMHFLIWCGRPRNDRARNIFRKTCVPQFRRQFRVIRARHVDHERRAGSRQFAPVRSFAPGRLMGSDEDHGR